MNSATIINGIITFGATIFGVVLTYLLAKPKKIKSSFYDKSINDISGKWNVFVKGSKNRNAIMELYQENQKVSGICEYYQTKAGKFVSMTFQYDGFYSAGQLVMTWKHKNSDFLIGAIVLKLEDEKTFIGQTSFWHHKKHTLDSDEFIMKRV